MKNYISELRRMHDLKQKEFGEIFNVSHATISSWENGRTDPGLETLVKISEKFDVSIDWLLTGKEHRLPDKEMTIINHFKTLDESQQNSIFEIIKSIRPNNKE